MSGMIPSSQGGINEERKVDLVLQGLRRDRPVTELCREAGISTASYYHWRRQFIDAAKASLTCSTTDRHALEERVRQLEAENTSLRRQVQVLRELCLAE